MSEPAVNLDHQSSSIERTSRVRGLAITGKGVMAIVRIVLILFGLVFLTVRLGFLALLFYGTLWFLLLHFLQTLGALKNNSHPAFKVLRGLSRYPEAENFWDRLRSGLTDWLNWL